MLMLLVKDRLVWRDKNNSASPGTMIHVMHMLFMFFAVFKNLKSSFSEDNMPVYALDVLNENTTKIDGLNYPIKHKK